MGTRSRIGKVQEDGTVKSIYCHWDGYLSNNGVLLFDHYQDPDKIDALLNLGDISSLDQEIGEKQDFDSPQKGTVVAYGRDRGEEDVDARVDESVEIFVHQIGDSWEEYTYLYQDGAWVCYMGDRGPFDLKLAIEEDE